ncbi:MAG: prefoldin subunit beta [Candidatus Woesearchaeota archaeon]
MNQDVQDQVNKLQMLEQSISSFSSQRQHMQSQLIEMNSALEHIEGKDKAFRIIGNLMVEQDASEIRKDISDRKESISVRIASLEKQEQTLKKQAQSIQESIMQSMKHEHNPEESN